jgi:hypothetical protein
VRRTTAATLAALVLVALGAWWLSRARSDAGRARTDVARARTEAGVGPGATRPPFDVVDLGFSVDRRPGRVALPVCDSWQGWQTEGPEKELAAGRAPHWLRRPPILPVIRVADALGLRPAAAAGWVAPVDPWWSLSLLEQEALWRGVDGWTRGRRWEAQRAADLRALAEQTGDPDLAAIADLADLRVEAAGPEPPSLETALARLRPDAGARERELALVLLCREGLELDADEHARLLRALRALDDPSITARAADLALRSAWNSGRAEPAEVWWSVLHEAQASCRRTGGRCILPGDLAQLGAHRARRDGGPPRDWREALAAGVLECQDVEPLTVDLWTAGRWVGGWRFDPATPFTDCLATRAALPPPVEGPYHLVITVSGAEP